MSMGDAFNECLQRRSAVHPKYKDQCPRLEVADSNAPTLKNDDAGSLKTCVLAISGNQRTRKSSPDANQQRPSLCKSKQEPRRDTKKSDESAKQEEE